ncbi:hypothetical protein N0V91_001486 [Didymella pomorum]|uniref:AA1-like domain-containing protein n=1 Tax=Didymella pomorum TaxID=749634 RepID=A0A9W8ZKF2_9PLEO|nr:hypothetical protein N0V91_001486 [Didymella pomorum]
MQFKLLAASLLATAGISTAAPLSARQDNSTCPLARTGTYVWEISAFSAHKPSGVAISTLSFDVQTTAGNLADFKCTGSDVADATWYECENSAVSFAFQNDRSGDYNGAEYLPPWSGQWARFYLRGNESGLPEDE